MSDAEIIMIFIGIIGLMSSFGTLIVSILTFLIKKGKSKDKK